MKKLLIAVLTVQFLFAAAYSADFLTSARGGGIGFSFFVLGDDPSGALYNPASLGFINGWQSQFMYNKRNNYGYAQWDENPYYGLFGAVYNQPEWGTFALNSVQSGSLLDNTDIPTVNYFTLSFGREFWPGLAMGTSIKYMDEYGFLERSAFDFDFGVTYRTTENIILAASAENIARSKLTPVYLGIAERLPRRSRAGGAYILETDEFQAAFLLASQIQEWGILEKHTTFLANFGTEWWFNRFGKIAFAARGGYTIGKGVLNDLKSDYNSFSGGLSVNYNLGSNDLRIDYGIETFPYDTEPGRSPVNHYFSLNFGWGGIPSYSRYEADEEYTENPPIQHDYLSTLEPKTYEPPQTDENDIDPDTEFDIKKFERYKVEMDVADISSMDYKRVVFYLRPQTIINTNSWKLYVFKAKIKKWSEVEIDRWALKVIEGKGLPPLNVVWDGISSDGRLLPPGKYYCILTAVDQQGRHFATQWHNFNLE
ncbi:MAG: hypothetical protein JSW64_05590 [Candidatus Zixiibacteriota bacterium]|nr:MAG: hypothetical protein JSW64_05590 [candidate division Zixibacteria bacterium]